MPKQPPKPRQRWLHKAGSEARRLSALVEHAEHDLGNYPRQAAAVCQRAADGEFRHRRVALGCPGQRFAVGCQQCRHLDLSARHGADLEQGAIYPVVDRVFDFDALPAAIERAVRGEQLGKLVLAGT